MERQAAQVLDVRRSKMCRSLADTVLRLLLSVASFGSCLAADPDLTIVSYSSGPVPPLDAQRTVELAAGSSVTLNCIGERAMTWSMPDVVTSGVLKPQNRFSSGRAVQSSGMVPECQVPGPGSKCYTSNITLSLLVSTDVGRVECRYADGSTQEQAFVFLLIDDPTSPGCLPGQTAIAQLNYVMQQENFVIPCFSPSSRQPVLSTVRTAVYDRQRGFVVSRPVPAIMPVLATCTCSNVFALRFTFRFIIQPDVPTLEIFGSFQRRTFLVGERVMIDCSSDIISSSSMTLTWVFPPTLQVPRDAAVSVTYALSAGSTSGKNTYRNNVTLSSVTLQHRGAYRCVATSASGVSNSAELTIDVVDTPVISFSTSGPLTVEADGGTSPQLVVQFVAIPPPTAVWVFKEDSNPLSSGQSYAVTNGSTGDNYTQTLTVYDVEQHSSGDYTLIVQAGSVKARRTITLLVSVPPTVVVDPTEPIYMSLPVRGWRSRPRQVLGCKATGVPVPTLSWMWQPCNRPACIATADAWMDLVNSSDPNYMRQNSPLVVLTADRESGVSIEQRQSSLYQCRATNKMGSVAEVVKLIVRNGDSNLFLVDQNLQLPRSLLYFAVGEVVNLTCYANEWMTGMPNFYRQTVASDGNSQIIGHTDPCCTIQRSRASHSNLVNIVFNATLNSTGLYSCEAEDANDVTKMVSTSPVQINVSSVVLPRLVSGLPATRSVKAGEAVLFSCIAAGFPPPMVLWLKDGQPLFDPVDGQPLGGILAKVSADGTNLTIDRALDRDKGLYTCVASNPFGSASSNTTLTIVAAAPTITRLSDTNIAIVVVIIVVVIAASVIATVFLVRRFCRKKAIPHEFLLPSKNMLNPDIPLDEQTDCLPYDADWEFPRDSLKFGMVLGQGAFGRVIKADAFGIEPGVAVTTVAVKSVRDPDDIEQIKALISELKILIHLGQHLNIVNLLGAVTRRLKRGELFVIVEYCRFGNLRSYLLKHKGHFVDVMDEESERSLAARLSTRRSVAASVSGGAGDASDDYLNSSSRSQMHCEENPLTTLDLIYWSFQICRGMQYLASIQYIHRDLAARNVLLADDNIVKICDFGLAKDIYKYHEYRKKTDGPLPIKWMALESLTHKLFTTASDVWSFGVTLWELFSLAATPYPSIELNEAFLEKLQAGYRMEQPKHAPDNIYKIMLKCWHPEAAKRPTFADLSTELMGMLAEPVRDHYLELEEPYMHKRDARDDYPPYYCKGVADSKDSDYLPVVSSAPDASQTATGPRESDYYNLGKSKTVVAEKGTRDEKLPLSSSLAHDDEDVFEGEDIPLPSCTAPLPNPEEVERYTKMQQVSKEKGPAAPAAATDGPKPLSRAAGSADSAPSQKEDRQLLLPQHSDEPPARHLAVTGGHRSGGTVETTI